jgi:hypothetical protein
METVKIDPAFLTRLRPEMDKALAEVAARHGIVIKMGNGSYDRSGLLGGFKIELAVVQEGQSGNPTHIRAAIDWNNNAEFFGLKKEWLGTDTIHKRLPHKIIGLMPSRSKFPVFVLTPDGKEMLLTVEGVRKSFGLPASQFDTV